MGMIHAPLLLSVFSPRNPAWEIPTSLAVGQSRQFSARISQVFCIAGRTTVRCHQCGNPCTSHSCLRGGSRRVDSL